MNKSSYMMKNTVTLFISNFSSKVLVFFLIPLYTSVLTDAEYGISDILYTSVTLLEMILTVCISEAILRFTMDKNNSKSDILNIGLAIVAVSAAIMFISVRFIDVFDVFSTYSSFFNLFLWLYTTTILDKVFSSYIKGKENITLIGITGIITTITIIISNIICLIVLDLGVKGYLFTYILSHVVAVLIYFFIGGIYKEISIVKVNKKLFVNMIQYSAPLVLVQVCWWVDSSVDRYVVAYVLGEAEAGLISVAHKLPSILTVFTTIFMQAWKLSAIKDFNDPDAERFFSKMFNFYIAMITLVGAAVILITKPVGLFLFKGDFVTAWTLAPFYILAFVFNSIASFLGSFYNAKKQTGKLMSSTFIGATVNLILDFILLYAIGLIGPGVATAISYLLIGIIRFYQCKQIVKITTNIYKIISSYLCLLAITILVVLDLGLVTYITSSIIFILIGIINFSQVILLYDKVIEIINKFLKERKK